jgi:hypothetical protein
MKGRKATRAIMLLRVTEIVRIRLDGAQSYDVTEYVAEKEREEGSPWHLAEGETPLSRRQIERYVQKADRIIVAAGVSDANAALAVHLARRENLFAKAVNAGAIRDALAVLIDMAKLTALYPAERHELTGRGGAALQATLTTVEMTDDERAAAVRNLFARAAGVGEADPRPDLEQPGNAAGPALGGPGSSDDRGGNDPGPLAGDVAPLF